jgi:flagellar biosynthesis protein FlhG
MRILGWPTFMFNSALLKFTIADVIKGNCELKDILHPGPRGVRIVPAFSGYNDMVKLDSALYASLIQSFSEIDNSLDVLIVDTAAGIGESVVSMVRAAQEVEVVLTPDPTSISDAYTLIRLLHLSYGVSRFRVLANMVQSTPEGHRLFRALTTITDRFLEVVLQFAGSVPYDKLMRNAVHQRRGIYDALPRSRFSRSMDALVQKINRWPFQSKPRGHQEFFVEKLIRMQSWSEQRCVVPHTSQSHFIGDLYACAHRHTTCVPRKNTSPQ